MKQFKKFLKEESKMKQFLKVYLLLLLLTLALAASPGSVWAITAANTQIKNDASLSYFDGTGTQVKTASVTVTVTLVPSAPTLAIIGAPYSTNYATGVSLIDTFTITATANGPDTYNLSGGTGTQVNNSPAGTATPSGSSIVIGATVTVAGSVDASHINVPYDGTSDGIVNGIAVNDFVEIGTDVRQVTAITENSTTGITTITLISGLGSTPTAGVLVAGQKTVTVTVTAGTITTLGQSVVVPAHLTALSNTDNSKTTTSADATNTFYSGLATLSKYVRNVTTDNHTAGAAAYTFNGNGLTYYYIAPPATAVNAKPGEVLEYVLVAANSGTGQVTSAVITDNVPTQYVLFKTGVYSGKDFQYWPDITVSGTSSTFTAASTNDDPAQYIASTLTVNVGGNPPPSLPTVGGTIVANRSVAVIYQATVNP